MKIITSILILISLSTTLVSQEYNPIKGKVSDINKEHLIGASILLYSEKDTTKIIDYSITNDKGEFFMKALSSPDKYLNISYLGYKKKKVKLLLEKKYYNIVLDESSNILTEVIIKAYKFKDTVRLKNDTIKFSNNTKLKDLLKDNEGIEITDENDIKYMGVPINKILINKKEVFVNQNSIALENITNEMVDNLQIINNYKDKFNVDFDNFNEMVLNIDVKNKFKGIIKNIIEIALGVEKAYFLKGKSFLFSDKLNVFLTQNTNSVLDKELNKNEIEKRQNNSSSFYNENIASITEGFERVKEDFYNNTNLLIKKENKNSKISTNVGFNYSNQKLETQILIDDNQIPISKELALNKRKGNILYADFNFTNLISKDFSISLFSNIDIVDNNLDWFNTKNIFTTSDFNSNTQYNSNNFILKNGLNSRKIFNQKWLWENNAEYIYEKTETNFLNNSNTTNVNQVINYNNQRLVFLSSLFYQKNNLFNYGINFKFSKINENITSQVNLDNQLIKRDFNQIKSSLISKGQNSKWNYFVNIGAKIFLFENQSLDKTTLPISTSFNYKFSSKKSISISYENDYDVENLENSLDSLYVNSTTLVTSNNILGNIQHKQNLTLSYNFLNISKSKSISFLAAGSIDNNFSQNSLIDFNSNINTFKKTIFNEKKNIYFENKYSKGFYFSKNDHNIQIAYKISSLFLESEVFKNNVLVPFKTEQFDVGMNFAFIPQKLFFTEFSLKFNYLKNNFYIDQQKINAIDINKNSVFLNKVSDNHIYSIEFYNELFKSGSEIINRNDFNISYRLYITKNSSIFIKGENIFNLFNINKNAGDLTTNSINNLNITTIKNNTFGYLITGIQFKL